MIKEFNTYLRAIDADFWKRLIFEHGTLKTFAKGDHFVAEGCVAREIGLIRKGSCKYVAYTANGDERIVGLETVDGFAASWPFCLHGMPSPVSIVANSDSEIHCLPVAKFKELMESDKEVERMAAHATEQIFYTIYERQIGFYTQTPKDRYDSLLEKCPRIFEAFDLKDIASFLNITPQHLSRLKKADSTR